MVHLISFLMMIPWAAPATFAAAPETSTVDAEALSIDVRSVSLNGRTSCFATTPCFDAFGRYLGRVSCQVYGYQHLLGLGVSANQVCQWNALYNVGVQCLGYQQVVDPFTGARAWTYANFNASCAALRGY